MQRVKCWSRSANAYIALLDPHRKNPECYWELRIASAMLRVLWRIRANGNGANDDAVARFDRNRAYYVVIV